MPALCGVAGHRQAERRAIFESELSDACAVEVIADGYAALLGADRAAQGAIVITGTGSVALRLDDDGRVGQFGGFDPVVGDEGGGNWLGRVALRSALRAMDDAAAGSGFVSLLSASLINLMGGRHESILDWIASADATRFAGLVPLILQHEVDTDPLAIQLLDKAAEETRRLILLIGRNGELPVSLLGGLADSLISRLPPGISSALVPPVDDPMEGALLRARNLAPPEVYAE